MTAVSLFSGIGGFDLPLSSYGVHPEFFCEIDIGCQRVLSQNFSGIPIHSNVQNIKDIPSKTTLVTGGFPCQDLSQAGRTEGIDGTRSGLVYEMLRLIQRSSPEWILIENVPFILRLQGGKGVREIIKFFQSEGYRWAYRVIDAISFGVPQRRKRFFFLASKIHDPAPSLLNDSQSIDTESFLSSVGKNSFGFYWTEGTRGLGLAIDSIPTLKGGSAVGVPSPPAILLPNLDVVTPSLMDAERLMGFPTSWTQPAEEVIRASFRWKMLGNAVSTYPVNWIYNKIFSVQPISLEMNGSKFEGGTLPDAAYGDRHNFYKHHATHYPAYTPLVPIHHFIQNPCKPLSIRATSGFLRRAKRSSLRFPDGFLDALERHLEKAIRIAV